MRRRRKHLKGGHHGGPMGRKKRGHRGHPKHEGFWTSVARALDAGRYGGYGWPGSM